MSHFFSYHRWCFFCTCCMPLTCHTCDLWVDEFLLLDRYNDRTTTAAFWSWNHPSIPILCHWCHGARESATMLGESRGASSPIGVNTESRVEWREEVQLREGSQSKMGQQKKTNDSTRWWQLTYFLFSSPPGENDPIWPIFFRWVGSTTNQSISGSFLKREYTDLSASPFHLHLFWHLEVSVRPLKELVSELQLGEGRTNQNFIVPWLSSQS